LTRRIGRSGKGEGGREEEEEGGGREERGGRRRKVGWNFEQNSSRGGCIAGMGKGDPSLGREGGREARQSKHAWTKVK